VSLELPIEIIEGLLININKILKVYIVHTLRDSFFYPATGIRFHTEVVINPSDLGTPVVGWISILHQLVV